HYGGVPGVSKGNAVPGLGDVFTKTTGLQASDPSTTRAQIDFVLDYAKSHDWSPWHGWKGDLREGLPDRPSPTGISIWPTPGGTPWPDASGAMTTLPPALPPALPPLTGSP